MFQLCSAASLLNHFPEESFQSITRTPGIVSLKGAVSGTQQEAFLRREAPAHGSEPGAEGGRGSGTGSLSVLPALFQAATRFSQQRDGMLGEKKGACGVADASRPASPGASGSHSPLSMSLASALL